MIQGIRKRAKSEATGEGQRGVLADHSTDSLKTNRLGMWGSTVRATHSREGEAGYTVSLKRKTRDTLGSPIVQTKLERIAEQARCYPTMVFTTLFHHIDVEFLAEAFRQIKKDKAAGVDKRTAREYQNELQGNLEKLHASLQDRSYKVHPVKRAWIDKGGGKKRPIGIPALEDKIAGRAVTMLLEAVYDNDFHSFSHGFRKGHSQHMAIKELRDQCYATGTKWIVDADVSEFFDSIDHKMLRSFLTKRVNDGRIRWLIDKWLKVGVYENGHVRGTKRGTPQGSVISPILANIFLHNVLDEWFTQEIQPRLYGRSFIVRFADDFIIGCENERDAHRIMKVLPLRFEKYNLKIHPEKTVLVDFNKPDSRKEEGSKTTFEFLGFTHYYGKSRNGNWTIKRKTAANRLARTMKSIWAWCRKNRHWSVPEQWQILCSKLRGHYNYYGIRCNYQMLEVVYWHTRKTWKRWLGRRTRNGQISWKQFEKKILTPFPLPMPKIVHNV